MHFQDFNAEVLRCLTIPNVNANLPKVVQPSAADVTNYDTGTEVHFFAGDWSEIDKLLFHTHDIEDDPSNPVSGYDIILMAETVYSISVLHNLYELIKKVLLY